MAQDLYEILYGIDLEAIQNNAVFALQNPENPKSSELWDGAIGALDDVLEQSADIPVGIVECDIREKVKIIPPEKGVDLARLLFKYSVACEERGDIENALHATIREADYYCHEGAVPGEYRAIKWRIAERLLELLEKKVVDTPVNTSAGSDALIIDIASKLKGIEGRRLFMAFADRAEARRDFSTAYHVINAGIAFLPPSDAKEKTKLAEHFRCMARKAARDGDFHIAGWIEKGAARLRRTEAGKQGALRRAEAYFKQENAAFVQK